jgi:hypothetical protein
MTTLGCLKSVLLGAPVLGNESHGKDSKKMLSNMMIGITTSMNRSEEDGYTVDDSKSSFHAIIYPQPR